MYDTHRHLLAKIGTNNKTKSKHFVWVFVELSGFVGWATIYQLIKDNYNHYFRILTKTNYVIKITYTF